jgi:hypothetical protein
VLDTMVIVAAVLSDLEGASAMTDYLSELVRVMSYPPSRSG